MNSSNLHSAIILLMSVLCLSAANPAAAAPPDDLRGVEIDDIFLAMKNDQGKYTVINARMDETATAAVLFGIAGALANSAINNSQDEELAERWLSVAEQLDISGLIRDSFLETMQMSNDVGIADEEDGASHLLTISLKDWGLIRRDGESADFRAFINVNVKMTDQRKRTVWRTYPNRVGKFVTADLEAFTDEVFERELTALARKVGQSIAYEIIYR